MCDDNCGKRPWQNSRICYVTGPTGPRGLAGPTARCNKSSIYFFKG